MRNPAIASLFIHLDPSRQLTFALGGLHLGALPCALANDLPVPIRLGLILLIALSAIRCIALHGTCRAAHAIVLLCWDREGRWRLVQRDGRLLDARLEHGAFSHPLLVVLPFRIRGGHRSCVLLVPDRIDPEHMRRLRVRLRCMSPGSDNSDAVC